MSHFYSPLCKARKMLAGGRTVQASGTAKAACLPRSKAFANVSSLGDSSTHQTPRYRFSVVLSSVCIRLYIGFGTRFAGDAGRPPCLVPLFFFRQAFLAPARSTLPPHLAARAAVSITIPDDFFRALPWRPSWAMPRSLAWPRASSWPRQAVASGLVARLDKGGAAARVPIPCPLSFPQATPAASAPAKMSSKKQSDYAINTLTTWLLRQEQKGQIDSELAVVISSIALACKQIASLVNRAGISNLTGLAGAANVQGEDQKKLDVISNEVFANCLRSSGRTGVLASEEEDTPVAVEESYSGDYIVVFDPLDGSSNIDAGISVG